MKALDTSLLVRYYTADDARQSAAATKILHNETALFVPKTVVLELWWALTSKRGYNLATEKVSAAIAHLAALENTVLEDAEAVEQALKNQRRGMGFEDALHLSSSAGCTELLTFDKSFARRANQLNLSPPCLTPA